MLAAARGALRRPLAASLRSQAPVAFAAQLPRAFAAKPLEASAKLYEDLVDKSVKEFQANQQALSSNLDAELASNKIVLFMEGTPDAPKSEPSLNVVKMLTQAQVVPLVTVDMLAHPAILGYSVSKSGKRRGPHLYVNGAFYGDHDSLLAQYNSGDLAKSLGSTATMSTGTFGGELPIATY
eukprot:TRINITY_DN2339_c0_g1_i2.p1 TRINITY_DN2339_c0_g1~~TRINITY_DN2339_c0_g1_i2.p1  ORF type:complete len:181 (+),score=47.87 TRINITY_DN2339_c0_g1_i2:88-630(+)